MKVLDSLYRNWLEFRARFSRTQDLVEEKRGDGKKRLILVVAPLFLGDLFMLSPFIHRVKVLYEGAELALVCRDELKEVANLFVSDHLILSRRPTIHSMRQLRKLAKYYSIENIYCLFSGHWLPALSVLSCGNIISFSEPTGRWNYLISNRIPFPKTPMLMVDIPLLLIDDAYGCASTSIPLNRWVPINRSVVIHVGARVASKRLNVNIIKTLVDVLHAQNVEITITAGPNEFDGMDQLRDLLGNNTFGLLCFELGSMSLGELPDLLCSARMVVGMDTGVIHMAKAMGVPTLVFLGPSQPELFGGDNRYSRSLHIGVAGLSCRKKRTVHGLERGWIRNCYVEECLEPSMYCMEIVNKKVISESIEHLLRFRAQ